MSVLLERIGVIQNRIAPEHRKPILEAVTHSDGTFLSFQQELSAQAWDHPELPVQEILDLISYDFA